MFIKKSKTIQNYQTSIEVGDRNFLIQNVKDDKTQAVSKLDDAQKKDLTPKVNLVLDKKGNPVRVDYLDIDNKVDGDFLLERNIIEVDENSTYLASGEITIDNHTPISGKETTNKSTHKSFLNEIIENLEVFEEIALKEEDKEIGYFIAGEKILGDNAKQEFKATVTSKLNTIDK